ncbi:hypothetical protein Q3G72_005909 [Acer saccharum]|nr:hypothetical protein Q3G72_005909 [Acer saccharum]
MAIFLGCAVYFYGNGVGLRSQAQLLSRLSQGESAGLADLQQMGLSPTRIAINPKVQKALQGAPFINSLGLMLEQSGEGITVAQLLSYMAAAAVLMAAGTWHTGCHPPAAMFLGLMSASFPVFYYVHLGNKRAAAFEAQLPAALELISLYLRSGRSLPQAFLAAADEIPPPAAQEFAVCAESYRLGRPLDIALKGLAVKYESLVGIRLFAVAVSVLGQTGGNLVEVLERIKKTLDAGITFTLKLRSMTGEARTSANILGAVPGLFMGITGLITPDYFNNFFETPLGLVLFALFLVFWVSGLVWVRMMMAAKA